MKKNRLTLIFVLTLIFNIVISCNPSPILVGTSNPDFVATFTPDISPIPTLATPTSTPIAWPIDKSIDIVAFQSSRDGDWFSENLFIMPEYTGRPEVSFNITDIPIDNRRDGYISPSLLAGYIYLQHNISTSDFDKYDHTINTLFIRSSLMSFVDYANDRVIIPWTLQSERIPADVRGIVELCNNEKIPVFIEINYSDYIPGQVGSGIDALEKTDTIANLVSYIKSLNNQGIYLDGVTFGDELEDTAGYGDIKPTIHNSDFIGRYISYVKILKSEFPDLKLYAFDSSINAAQGRVSKYKAYFNRIRQAELEENKNLIDGFIYRESYVYIDENGNLLESQFILDDTESLYRDSPVYRYDVPGVSFPNPDRDYLHTLINITTEIFNRPIDIGLTEYLPAGPPQLSETDTSQYLDIDFIIHYSDIVGIYSELGLDIISKIMFGDSTQMHESYFDRDGNLGVNYPVYEQLAEHYSGQIIQVVRSVDYEELKVKVYVAKEEDKYFLLILNKDASSDHAIELNLPNRFTLILQLPRRSYTSLIVNRDEITLSGIGH
jgi:hypothetical protein